MRSRRRTLNGISWVEVAPSPQPAIDAPIRPLTQATLEVAVSLYGDPAAGRDAARRRKVDAVLAKHGVRPRGTW